MNQITDTIVAARSASQDVNILLRAIALVLRLSEGRLSLHLHSSDVDVASSISKLSADIETLHGICRVLGQLTLGLVSSAKQELLSYRDGDSSGRAELPSGDDLHGELEESLLLLEASETALIEIEAGIAACRKTLDQMVMRNEFSPEARAEVSVLLHRIRYGLTD